MLSSYTSQHLYYVALTGFTQEQMKENHLLPYVTQMSLLRRLTMIH